jgi:hypothetical protein
MLAAMLNLAPLLAAHFFSSVRSAALERGGGSVAR